MIILSGFKVAFSPNTLFLNRLTVFYRILHCMMWLLFLYCPRPALHWCLLLYTAWWGCWICQNPTAMLLLYLRPRQINRLNLYQVHDNIRYISLLCIATYIARICNRYMSTSVIYHHCVLPPRYIAIICALRDRAGYMSPPSDIYHHYVYCCAFWDCLSVWG